MQRDSPQAGLGNPGYQVRSLEDPATHLGNSLITVEPAAESDSSRDRSGATQGFVAPSRGTSSFAGARAGLKTTSSNAETSTGEKN